MRGTLLTLPPTFWFIPRFSICVVHPYSNPFTSIRVPVVLTSTKLCQFWSIFNSTNVYTNSFDTHVRQSIFWLIPNHHNSTYSHTRSTVHMQIHPISPAYHLFSNHHTICPISDQSKISRCQPNFDSYRITSASALLRSVQTSQFWFITTQ